MVSEAGASAPGKILWIGGYSVLEKPNMGYVTTVKAYVSVNSRPLEGNVVELNAPQLNMDAKGAIDSEGRLNIEVPKELLLLKTSVEVGLRYASFLGVRPSGISISTKSDEAFSYRIEGERIAKSGLGSSAALTVATIASVLRAMEVKANKNQIHKLAQIAHSMATGKVGSGFDIAAATYGSILYTRYSPEIVKSFPSEYSNRDLVRLVKKKWDYTVERFPMPKAFRIAFANFIDESMTTTASLGSVSEFKKNQPEMYAELIKELNAANLDAIEALRKIGSGEQDALGAFKESFEKGRVLTKELGNLSKVGIEPDDCTSLIEESQRNGAFVAKLPGAGGKDAVAALSLSIADERKLRRFWKARRELSVLEVKNGGKGFR